MSQISAFIQKEVLNSYKIKYSNKYIEEKIIPIIDYINISKKNKFLISGSQGIGKSTIINIISKTLTKFYRKKVLVLSLDDYYLSKKERADLSKNEHKLLETRGVPGTHNIKELLIDINKFEKKSYPISLPIFDKLIDNIINKKKIIRSKHDILILEGWCCGCRKIKKKYLYKNINILERKFDSKFKWRNYYNKKLRTDYKKLFEKFEEKIYFKAPSFKIVHFWRYRQEINNKSTSMKSKKMDFHQIKIFIQYYEKITRWMMNDYSKIANLVINVDKNQNIKSIRKN